MSIVTGNAARNITYYFDGLGLIGELTDDWNYSLPDGGNTPRQLTDAAGEVTYFARYTPGVIRLKPMARAAFHKATSVA